MQWFPGHMAKAIRQINELKKLIDLFIIVLDARAPLSTYNPEFDAIIKDKNKLFVLAKTDLGDPIKINKLIQFLPPNQGVISLNLKNHQSSKKLLQKIHQITEDKVQKNLQKGIIKTTLKVAVIGMPNVGKSTLINLLVKKQKAKVANIPGVTRGKQWIKINNILLLDTPGILMPKINDEIIAIKLATLGLIKDIIVNKYDLLTKSYTLISNQYPAKILNLGLEPSTNPTIIAQQVEKLAIKKKFYSFNKQIDIKRSETFLINYFKNLHGITYD